MTDRVDPSARSSPTTPTPSVSSPPSGCRSTDTSAPPAWSSSSPTRTCCSTRPATSPAPSRSTGTPTSTTRSSATTSTARASPSCSAARASRRDTTVVIYGDKNNWWAAYALWVFTLFGHEDVRLLDGGRAKWEAEGRALHDRRDPGRRRRLPRRRARRQPTSAPSRTTCSPTSATPSSTCARPRSTAVSAPRRPPTPKRARCAPATSRRAQNVPWATAAADDGTFKPLAELDAIYRDGAGLSDGDEVIAYCRIGERSSHTWFVLHPPAGLRGRPQLRRLVDRVGQRRARPDRAGRRAG